MIKIFIYFILLFFLLSCVWNNKEEIKNDTLKTHLETKILEEKNKFDKSTKREKVQGFTGFLCFNEELNWTWFIEKIETKNCKNEKWKWVIYFKLEWENLVKYNELDEKEFIIKHIEKKEKEFIWISIKKEIIWNFKNILDKQSCLYKQEKKKKILIDNDNIVIYNISAFWYYKNEADEHLKIDNTIQVCEWYYPNWKFILFNKINKIWFWSVKEDKLVNLNSLKVKTK